MYVRESIGTLSRESRVVVVRAINCVIAVAKTMCHVVKNRAREECERAYCSYLLPMLEPDLKTHGNLHRERVLLAKRLYVSMWICEDAYQNASLKAPTC